MSRWFRFYDEALDDPKVQALPPDLFKAWVNLLCLAARHEGKIPPVGVCAFALRMSDDEASTVISRLSHAGLLDTRQGGVDGMHHAIHGWDKRQYKSDTSTGRVKRFRERSNNVSETAPETEAETEKKEPKGSSKKRGCRLPEDWQPDEVFAAREGLTAWEISQEADKFRDYWRGIPGQRGVKVDWAGAWRNWVRKAASGRRQPETRSVGWSGQEALRRGFMRW